jgi:translation elongation factor EF-Tu-like GTPase
LASGGAGPPAARIGLSVTAPVRSGYRQQFYVRTTDVSGVLERAVGAGTVTALLD